MRRICVYCGSSPGGGASYLDAARRLGELLARRRLGLVYGGASVGLMGAIADAVVAAGGEAIGVIPEPLVARELAHAGLTELHVVASMHERKALMAGLSDAFVALPGGLGTVEELFEVLTWSQLGLHRKPCGVLNVRGYWDLLTAFLDHAVAERFLLEEYRAMLLVEEDAGVLLDRLATYELPVVPQWLDQDET